jgi:hypothetical protein
MACPGLKDTTALGFIQLNRNVYKGMRKTSQGDIWGHPFLLLELSWIKVIIQK